MGGADSKGCCSCDNSDDRTKEISAGSHDAPGIATAMIPDEIFDASGPGAASAPEAAKAKIPPEPPVKRADSDEDHGQVFEPPAPLGPPPEPLASPPPPAAAQAAKHDSRPEEFRVTCRKTPGKKLGIDVDLSDGLSLFIDGVRDGIVMDWNNENPSLQVRTGDRIVEVNGHRNNNQDMTSACVQDDVLEMVVTRGGA